MESYYFAAKLLVATGLALQCSLLAVQVWALSKHRQLHFVLLVAGAFVGLIYAAAAASPLVFPMGLQARTLLAQASVTLLALGGTLGVWGMVLFVRSYGQLVQPRARAKA